jgi:hypothetical protein
LAALLVKVTARISFGFIPVVTDFTGKWWVDSYDHYTLDSEVESDVWNSGSEVKISMDISDVEIDITEWLNKTHQIESGELIYIEGLTKGITKRKQVFSVS